MHSSFRNGNNNSLNNNNINYNNSNNNYANNNINYSSNNFQNPQNQLNNNRMIIEDNNLSSEEEQNQNMKRNNRPYKREADEESAFSFFSTFQDFKNSPLYKNRKQICFNVLISFLILVLAIGILYFIFNSFETITNFFADFFNLLMDPRRIIQIIFGFISTLLFGSLRYFYITIPLIALIIFMIFSFKKYIFEKRCKEIIKKIEEYLRNNQNRGENNIISEDDIFKLFVQGYGVSYTRFIEKYIKTLRNMRRNETTMKLNGKKVNGKEFYYWTLD